MTEMTTKARYMDDRRLNLGDQDRIAWSFITMAGQLDEFCRMIKSEKGDLSTISPEDLAKVFVSHSGLSSSPSLMELHSVLHKYGVAEITAADMSSGKLKGHHFSYRDKGYTVMYEKDLWMGSIEHVMLHELYEIIAERCEKWCPGYKSLPMPDICPAANRFAAAALMQTDIFLKALFESGFDIVQLHHRFWRAYSSVAIRAVDVLKQRNEELVQEEKIDLMVTIYERMEQGKPSEWSSCTPDRFEVRYSVRTTGIKLGTRGGVLLPGGRLRGPIYRGPRYPGHLIPKIGDGVLPNSIVCQVINTAQCHCLQRVTGFDLWGSNDFTFVAQPVLWFGKLAKVVLVGVRYKDRRILNAQLEQIAPVMIGESYQVI